MLELDHGYHHSQTDSLIAARSLLMVAGDGSDDLLFEHFDAYAGDSRLLDELLTSLAAAAEENHKLADTARRLWPTLVDRGLERVDALTQQGRHDRVYRRAIAAFMPNPSADFAFLYRELEADPIVWTDVEAWRPQVERWLPVAAGHRESVDSLVHLLLSLSNDKQGPVGLSWVEALVRADPDEIASKSYLLPTWLRDVQAHLQGGELIDCWQRIVDMLIVAGDSQVAELAD
jgi:hypothetical protein